MKQSLAIGTRVTNFGQVATVVGFHEITGDPILQDVDGLKWIADPAKCEILTEGWMHKDGLVIIG